MINIGFMRLKVYNYKLNCESFVLLNPFEIRKFVRQTPEGYFPIIILDENEKVIGYYSTGYNGTFDKGFRELQGGRI